MGLISTDLQEVTKHSHELNFGVIGLLSKSGRPAYVRRPLRQFKER